jgi:mono/diheme cytochrome c family protein
MRSIFMLGVLAAAISTSAAAQGADGKAVYEANCRKCHGPAGKPSDAIKKMSPKIATFDAAFFEKRTDEDLVKQITEGKDKMKPFKDKLSADEIAAVAKYIRTLGK